MFPEPFGRERWERAWEKLGAPPPEGLWQTILAYYSQPHRHYHTLRHLEECFGFFDRTAHLAAHPAEVELALWFHDAIYDPRGKENEEDSARLAEEALRESGIAEKTAARVRDLVLATKHRNIPKEADARLVADVDLSILGAREDRFAEYERQIRKEYDWVEEAAFRKGRAEVLRSFLDRPSLFGTEWFAERLEVPARKNLSHTLTILTGRP